MEWRKISWRWFINNVKEPTHKKREKLKIIKEEIKPDLNIKAPKNSIVKICS